MNEKLLTIVVPAYNVENYIGECLGSIVNQTKSNHKIIIVNDGSSDDTEKICMEYKSKYPDMIHYIYQENQGLGGARNTGMRCVNTPYVTFLDSDDWLNIKYVECFEKLIRECDEMPDIIFTLPWVYDSVTKRINQWKDKNRYDAIFNTYDGGRSLITNVRLNPELYALEVNACRKIYRTEFLKDKDFSFPLKLKWEDVPGHFYLLHYANTCVALPEVGFFYRTNQSTQITSGGGKSRLDMIPIFEQLLELQKNNNFTDVEKAYIIRLIVDFSMWSIEVTNKQYIKKLLDGLHHVFETFSDKEIENFINICSENRTRDFGLITCLANSDYLELEDYVNRNNVIMNCSKNKEKNKKGLFHGGVKCICEHGISYTVIWMFRKYILRRG